MARVDETPRAPASRRDRRCRLRRPVHVVGLTGFKNRVAALFNWTIAFLGRGRPQRVITAQQVFARRALQLHPAAMPSVQAGDRHGTRPAHPRYADEVQP